MRVEIKVAVSRSDGRYSWDRLAELEVLVEAESIDCIPWTAVCAGAVEKAIADARAAIEAETEEDK